MKRSQNVIRICSKISVVDLDPDWIRIKDGAKRPRKTVNNFHLSKCWMFSLRTEGFLCSLDVLHKGLGISKLQVLIKKRYKKSSTVSGFFSSFNFWSSKPWMRIRIRINLKCRPRTDHACPQKQNPSRETVP
jgi:hypothetical protein